MTRDKAYLKAEAKIEEARRSGVKKLNLGTRYNDKFPKLTELPDTIGQLTQLQSLDLTGNRLTTLPESLTQLTQLQSLNLYGNQLTALPEWLGQLTQLQSLVLAGNLLTVLPESLFQLAQLRSLDLMGNQLATLPENIGNLTQLRSLVLIDNELTILPESLFQLTQLRSLGLTGNQLTALQESLGHLTQLQTLTLGNNQLTALPESLGQLAQLQWLKIECNQLTALPRSIGYLLQLKDLDIHNNNITQLPDSITALECLKRLNLFRNKIEQIPTWISKLKALDDLGVGANPISSLPDSLGECMALRVLDLGDFGGGIPIRHLPNSIRSLKNLNRLLLNECHLKELPEWIGELDQLQVLYLADNQLTDLPTSLGKLKNLETLELRNNPLNPELAAVYKKGLDNVKRYLREMAKGGRNRYEAKLLILGDGNEGKTCVSRALRGLPFRVQKTTRGVDVVQWKFPHPDDEANQSKEIALNIWDFEGQEISHQTHQFFLTSQALYLLVFKCRDQFLMDRVEYWLDTIRARAPLAKVVLVISQCEERSPHIPLDRIEAQYRDMLAKEWFFAVGCENGKNIHQLQAFLRRSAADLDFMGLTWPKSYEKAEVEINKMAKTKMPHITRSKLNAILRKAGVNADNYEGAASSMARIGAITQFPDCPDLRDFVVLKPQWLTKAIRKVMEDGQLTYDKGEISLKRMESIWTKANYHGLFLTFHNCMKEFELCYDLDGRSTSCLVPLRFGYVEPTIRWTNVARIKERRMEYKLNVRPPMGVMSRFIVKTHHMIAKAPEQPKGIYWHNGVFLRSNSPYPSEALCEFLPDDRILRVRVRAAFPQNMCEQIHGYIQAVFSFFGGLSVERSYGCIKVDAETGAESQCKGLYTEKRIYTAISKQRKLLDCEFEDHEVDPRLLVSGISSFGGFVEERLLSATLRRELDKAPEWAEPYLRGVETLVEWAQCNGDKLDQLLHRQSALSEEFKQEAELKLREYLACINQMLDDRDHTAAPGLFLITPKDRSPWNPVGYFNRTYILTPFCECAGNIHACEDGNVIFTKDRDWWIATAPWVARATKLLAAGLQLAFAGMPLALGTETAKLIEDDVKFMEALTAHVSLEVPEAAKETGVDKVFDDAIGKDLRANDRETAITRTALARFLEDTAPNNYRARRWGSLSRVRMPDNSFRWLCDACATKGAPIRDSGSS